jgi:hypothetical protein
MGEKNFGQFKRLPNISGCIRKQYAKWREKVVFLI